MLERKVHFVAVRNAAPIFDSKLSHDLGNAGPGGDPVGGGPEEQAPRRPRVRQPRPRTKEERAAAKVVRDDGWQDHLASCHVKIAFRESLILHPRNYFFPFSNGGILQCEKKEARSKAITTFI